MTRTRIVSENSITNPDNYRDLLKKYANKRVEHFLVTTLNGANAPIHTYIVTVGLVNRTMVHPREVFWFAIKDMAAAVVIAHNHPSGDMTPSPEDKEITTRLKEAGEILGINVLDHIIFSRKGYFSFLQAGIF